MEKEIVKKKKKKKKQRTGLAAFFGKGDGTSGATMPPFRTNMSNPKLGQSLPGPSGQNAPQYGTLPVMGGTSGVTSMVASDSAFDDAMKKYDKMLRSLVEGDQLSFLKEHQHICLICSGTGVTPDLKPCHLCSKEWVSDRVNMPQETLCVVEGPIVSKVGTDTVMFSGFDRGWDLESRQLPANLLMLEQNQELTIHQYQALAKRLVPMFVVNDKNTKSKFDILVDKIKGAAHLIKTVYTGQEWTQARTVPERASSITHIGVFKDSSDARRYLRNMGLSVV